jgi:hypothetical protein
VTAWTLIRFLHLAGVAFFVGGQLLLAAAVAPAVRRYGGDEAMQSIARRFGIGSGEPGGGAGQDDPVHRLTNRHRYRPGLRSTSPGRRRATTERLEGRSTFALIARHDPNDPSPASTPYPRVSRSPFGREPKQSTRIRGPPLRWICRHR